MVMSANKKWGNPEGNWLVYDGEDDKLKCKVCKLSIRDTQVYQELPVGYIHKGCALNKK